MVYPEWTLQELVAPRSVKFFSTEGERLGEKAAMTGELHSITGISIRAPQGVPLSEFGVDERFSWAEKRETKHEEDATYSLLGLFDIHMPLIYGEGQMKALIRLRKEIEESQNHETHALEPAHSIKQPKRNQHDVTCYKCLYFWF
jgi:hypothetical protein